MMTRGGSGVRARADRPAVAAPSHRPFRKRFPFAIPGIVVYGAFIIVPLILSLYYSFTNRSLLTSNADFVGFDNYTRLATDSRFLDTFAFTLILTAVTLVGVNVLGLAIAVLLNRVGRLFYAMRMLFFIPVALSFVIVAFLWSTILTDNGILNTMLRETGLGALATSWLGTPTMAQVSVILVSGWQGMSLAVVIFLAGLQTVPPTLYDAAKIDGADRWNSFRYVTWPFLGGALTINSTLLLINGFKSYDIPVVLTATGPGHATSMIATEVIRVGFKLTRAGLASAMAIVMVVVAAAVTLAVVALLQRREVDV